MLRVVALVAVVSRVASAQPACGPLPADLPAKTAAAEKARDASYEKALAAKKLGPWTGSSRIYSDRGQYDTAATPPRPDVQLIDLGSHAYTAPTVELVSDRKGVVYRVVRSPTGSQPRYTQCGCGPITHGGAAPPINHYVLELPNTVKYGGDAVITYTDKTPILTWTNMRNGQPCPLPP
jgi:hypothetical protein